MLVWVECVRRWVGEWSVYVHVWVGGYGLVHGVQFVCMWAWIIEHGTWIGNPCAALFLTYGVSIRPLIECGFHLFLLFLLYHVLRLESCTVGSTFIQCTPKQYVLLLSHR